MVRHVDIGLLGYVSNKDNWKSIYIYIFHTIEPSSREIKGCILLSMPLLLLR